MLRAVTDLLMHVALIATDPVRKARNKVSQTHGPEPFCTFPIRGGGGI